MEEQEGISGKRRTRYTVRSGGGRCSRSHRHLRGRRRCYTRRCGATRMARMGGCVFWSPPPTLAEQECAWICYGCRTVHSKASLLRCRIKTCNMWRPVQPGQESEAAKHLREKHTYQAKTNFLTTKGTSLTNRYSALSPEDRDQQTEANTPAIELTAEELVEANKRLKYVKSLRDSSTYHGIKEDVDKCQAQIDEIKKTMSAKLTINKKTQSSHHFKILSHSSPNTPMQQ